MNFLCELRFIHFSRVGLPASTPTFRRREDSFAHHVGVQARRDDCRERRLLPAAETRNEEGGHPLLDRQCACEDRLVARGRFRVLRGARHRHGARHERIGPEVPDVFCYRRARLEQVRDDSVDTVCKRDMELIIPKSYMSAITKNSLSTVTLCFFYMKTKSTISLFTYTNTPFLARARAHTHTMCILFLCFIICSHSVTESARIRIRTNPRQSALSWSVHTAACYLVAFGACPCPSSKFFSFACFPLNVNRFVQWLNALSQYNLPVLLHRNVQYL